MAYEMYENHKDTPGTKEQYERSYEEHETRTQSTLPLTDVRQHRFRWSDEKRKRLRAGLRWREVFWEKRSG